MLRNEAHWLGKQLASVAPDRLSPILNVGSSNGDFRRDVQPWIDTAIFQPLKERRVDVKHLDIAPGPNVDITGDITEPEFVSRLRDLGIRSVFCSNLLEHVPQPELVCARLEALVPRGGLLFVSVPFRFPYHPDPIDTMFRPHVDQLVKLFPDSRVITAEVVPGGTSWSLAAGGVLTVGRKAVRRLVSQTRVQASASGGVAVRGTSALIPWLFRSFEVSCAVLEKAV
jgi:hypothetical protein